MLHFKFLHAADLHLDSPLRGLEKYPNAPSLNRIRYACREALENLVRLAQETPVQFVLLSGDIYDGDWKDYATGLFFSAQMARLRQADIPVFLIRGNHDALNQMTRSLDLPDNVRVFPEEDPVTYRLDNLHIAVHGQSFAARVTEENLAAAYPAPLAGYFNIGLLHTSLQGSSRHDPYAPCTVEQLAQKGYDYWALGHIHQRQVVKKTGPTVVFPGNLQGRHVRETGAKGCHLVEVNAGRIQTNEFQPLDVVRWQALEVNANDLREPVEVLGAVETTIQNALANADHRLLAARLSIVGATAAHEAFAAERERWIQQVRALCTDRFGEATWLEEVRFTTRPPGDAVAEQLPADALAELQGLIEELGTDDNALEKILADLRHLDNRLPAALKHGDEQIQLTRAENTRVRLDRVLPLITSPHWHAQERP